MMTKFIVMACLDCDGYEFAIPESENKWNFNTEHQERVSEFRCPNCGNELWEECMNLLGEVTFTEKDLY
jgi:hypothetical protein